MIRTCSLNPLFAKEVGNEHSAVIDHAVKDIGITVIRDIYGCYRDMKNWQIVGKNYPV